MRRKNKRLGSKSKHSSSTTPHSSPLTPYRSRAEAVLIIFAKAPIPGQVKTRLCPPLTHEEAATLHGSFVLDMLERSGEAIKKDKLGLDRIVACFPAPDHAFFKFLGSRYGVRLLPQVGEDLGARMHHMFQSAFALGYRKGHDHQHDKHHEGDQRQFMPP